MDEHSKAQYTNKSVFRYLLSAVVVLDNAIRHEKNGSRADRKDAPFSLRVVPYMTPCGAVVHGASVKLYAQRFICAADDHCATLIPGMAVIEHRVVGTTGSQTVKRSGAV